MFNWLKKIINPDILGGVDGFPRFPTSYSPFITTPTVKREYKREPWDGGKTYQRDATLCWHFPYSPASPFFPFLRLSSPPENPCFQDLCFPLSCQEEIHCFLGPVGTQNFGGSACHLRPWVEELGAWFWDRATMVTGCNQPFCCY
jgi:hypothetical protein